MKPPIFLGQLLLRSMDRAVALYESMELRGFHGEFYYAEKVYNILELILKIIVFGDLANTAYSDWASVSNRGGNSA